MKINDKKIEITDNKINLKLLSNKGKENYVIWVKDSAGNEKTITVAVWDEWTKLDYVPNDKTISKL